MKHSNGNAHAGKINGINAKRRILLVDDHVMMREGLKELINRQSDLTVCGEAGDAHAGLDMMEKTHPDLVLVDISLPGLSGLEFIKILKLRHPEVFTMVLSMHDEPIYAERAFRGGALAYICKKESSAEVLNAIRCTLSGEFYVGSFLGNYIFRRFLGNGKKSGFHFSPSQLSDRELKIFELIGRGLKRSEIAGELNISAKTVDVHNDRMKRKLDLASSTQLARIARQWIELNRNS